MKIGEKIRRLRKEQKITLRTLSNQSNIALATLSRIETGKMTGTVESHQAVAKTLGVSLSQLYGDIDTEQKQVEFQSIKNRTDTYVHNDKASYLMLTSNVLSKKMMPVILKIAPKGKSTKEELPKNTEKFIYILKGQCEISVENQTHLLKRGETLCFDASLAHCFINTGTEELQAVCVITPPAL